MQQSIPTKEAGPGAAHDRARPTFVVAAIAVLVGLAYVNTLFNGFVFDDHLIIESNPLIRALRHLPTLFTTDYWEGGGIVGELHDESLYRPLVLTTYMVNYMTTGLATWAFHLTNVLIHLGVVIALYGVACRLGLGAPGALAAALVFAVHPLNTEAVTGIVGRAELLMALGVLLAFYWDLVKNAPEAQVTKVSCASVAAFALSLFSKEQAIMFPALLFFVDGMRTRRAGSAFWRTFWQARFRYLAYGLALSLYAGARLSVLGTAMPAVTPIENPLATVALSTGLINAVKIAGSYLWLAVWPAKLSADYSYDSLPMTAAALEPAVWVSALVWSALLAVGVIAFSKRRRPAAIGVAIAFLFFLPVSNFFLLIGTVMGERLFYLPLAGLCLLLGAGYERVWHASMGGAEPGRRIAVGAAIAVFALAPLTVRTIARNRDWVSDATLFASVLRAYPNNAKALYLIGNGHVERMEFDKAFAMYQSALAIVPQYTHVIKFARSYGRTLLRLGRTDEAIAVFEEGIRANAGIKDPWIHRLLAVAHELNKDYAPAATSLQRAIAIGQEVSMTSTQAIVEDYNQLAKLYALEQRNGESRRALEKALSVVEADPHLPESQRTALTAQVLGNLALLDTTEGAYADAEEKYLRLLELLETEESDIPRQLRVARLREYARLLRKMGRDAKATRLEREAAALGTH